MITIKRGTAIQAEVEIDDRTVYTKKLMGEHKITTEFFVESPLGLEIGDYIEHDNEVFTMNRMPEITKLNLKTFKYKVDFEGPVYDLYNKLFMYDGVADFHYTGTPADFLSLIVNNINNIDESEGWSSIVGDDVNGINDQTIHFEGDSCRTALTRIAETFSVEFALLGKQIKMEKSVGRVTSHEFEYGRGNGLYQLDRKQVNSQNVVTRVYGFGSEKNIPYDYRERAKRLVFDDDGKRYLENNTELYGVIEAQFTDDTIYPTRTGTVTAASVHFGNTELTPPDWPEFYIEDTSLITDDLDLNEYSIDGDTRKIVFKTGSLTGYELDIKSYDHSRGRIYYELFSEADGLTMPDANNQPIIGDTYTLINIKMPQAYVDNAENRLKLATQEYLAQNSVPQVIYGLEFDQKYVKANNIHLDVGDNVRIFDEQLGITSETIRVSEITYPLVNPNKMKATIADFVPYTIQEKTIKTAIEAQKETYFVERKSAELARRNTTSLNRLKGSLLDQDGYFTAPIRPRSIETLYLAVGARPSNLRLSGATFKENYGGDVDSFYASPCQVIHLEFEIENVGYTWIINDGYVRNNLVGTDTYYLYAKCHKENLTGSWELNTNVIPSDPAGDFYYFGVGVLLPADEETPIRDFLTIYGKTYINGRNITTGRVQSIDGNTYFDLDAGEIGGVIKFRNSSGDYTDVNDIDGRVSSTETSIGFLNGKIASKVENTEFNILSGMVSSHQSTIEQNASDINLTIQSYTDIDHRVEGTEEDISGLQHDFTSDNIVAQINLSSEGVRIYGDSIKLDGDTEVDGSFSINNGTFNLGNGNFVVDGDGHMTAIGGTFKSSETGKRIEISNSDNLIAVYDSTNRKRITVGTGIFNGEIVIGNDGTILAENYLQVKGFDGNNTLLVSNNSVYARNLALGSYVTINSQLYSHSSAPNNSIYILNGQLHFKRPDGSTVRIS